MCEGRKQSFSWVEDQRLGSFHHSRYSLACILTWRFACICNFFFFPSLLSIRILFQPRDVILNKLSWIFRCKEVSERCLFELRRITFIHNLGAPCGNGSNLIYSIWLIRTICCDIKHKDCHFSVLMQIFAVWSWWHCNDLSVFWSLSWLIYSGKVNLMGSWM